MIQYNNNNIILKNIKNSICLSRLLFLLSFYWEISLDLNKENNSFFFAVRYHRQIFSKLVLKKPIDTVADCFKISGDWANFTDGE